MAHITNKLRGLVAAFVAVFAALALVPGTAFAEWVDMTEPTGSIFLNGDVTVEGETPNKITVYKVAKIQNESVTNETKVVELDGIGGVVTNEGTGWIYEENATTAAAVAAAAAQYGQKLEAVTDYTIADKSDDTGVEISDLEPGVYFIDIEDTADIAFQNIVAAVGVARKSASENEWVADDADVNIDLKSTSSTITKQAKIDDEWGNATTAELGDELEFQIKFSIGSNMDEFYVADVMKGLDLQQSTVQLTNGTDITMTIDQMKQAGFTVEYQFENKVQQRVEGLKITFPATWMAEHPGDYIVTYKANVNSDMSVDEGAENSAYTNISDTDSTVTVDYSNLDIVKTGSDEGNPQLAGAEFKIYRTMTPNEGAAPTFSDPVMVNEDTELVLTTLGQVGVDGLNVTANGDYFLDPAETYYVVETKAPAEYKLPDNGGLVAIIGANATEDDNKLEANKTLTLDVVNTHSEDGEGVDLPVTGGAGTVAMTAAGVVLVAGAAAFIVRSRKQN